MQRLPLVAVNHIEAHFYANMLTGTPSPTLVVLIASGGMPNSCFTGAPPSGTPGTDPGRRRREVFDRWRALKLGYPGGPLIDRLAKSGNPEAIAFPRAYLDEASRYDFSFSGLKSAVINYLHHRQQGEPVNLPDLTASFQAAVIEVLVEKTICAARDHGAATVLLAGGVAANSLLRRNMGERLAQELPGTPLRFPPRELCTDNAAMIAAAAYPLYQAGRFASLDLNAVPGLTVGSGAAKT